MNDTLLLAPDLLHTMRAAAHKAIELDEPLITMRCILLALLDDQDGVQPEILHRMLQGAGTEEETPSQESLAFKTPDGGATVTLSSPAYALFIEGARKAADRYTRAELVAALAARAS